MTKPESGVELPVLTPHPVLPDYYQRAEERRGFVRQIFDRTAVDYDRIERLIGFGTGPRYRGQALIRAGLRPGMRVLDVAMGTGLVARQAAAIVGPTGSVIGLDPSAAMMRSGDRSFPATFVQGTAERLPFADEQFDFLSFGFALRHVADMQAVFREFRRVLRPDGVICMLEITPPASRWGRRVLKFYLGGVVPWLSHAVARDADTPRLFRYFWDTIDACVAPAQVLEGLTRAGLHTVRRRVIAQVFSEYTAQR